MKSVFVVLFVIIGASYSAGAPTPATSTSPIISELKGQFISPLGFRIHSEKTNWILSEPPMKTPHIVTLYKAPETKDGVQGALTVRVDRSHRSVNLKRYVHKWLKDYPRFGFTILRAKPVLVNEQKAFVIDLVNKKNKKQLRQVLFGQEKTMVILTCRDHNKNFSETLKTCNQLFKNFSWQL